MTDLRHLHNEITSNYLKLLYVEYFSNLLALNVITTKSMSYGNLSGLFKSVLLCQLSYAGVEKSSLRPRSKRLGKSCSLFSPWRKTQWFSFNTSCPSLSIISLKGKILFPIKNPFLAFQACRKNLTATSYKGTDVSKIKVLIIAKYIYIGKNKKRPGIFLPFYW